MKSGPNRTLRFRQLSLCLVATLFGQRLPAADVDVSKLPPPAAGRVNFTRDIKPILENNCLRCHGPEKPRSHFRLDNRVAALKGGENGVDILPHNSANSPLIHYTAYLVEDMEMPPEGKGKQLTAQQVALLRAWIDQGAVWDAAAPTNGFDISISPTFGGTVVNGDAAKFRELYWQKDGLNGGVEQFELFKQTDPDTKLLFSGHALVNDYKIDMSVDRNDVGFIHAGWEQFRKYYDDTGGYYPALAQTAPSLGENLYLDIGKAWIDFGLTLPNWPQMVLGYEYDYKQGNEATTEWGSVGANQNARGIAPAGESVNETVHTLKFDLNYEIRGVTVEERFRGEFYNLSTGSTNVASGPEFETVNEGTHYFQGANTITAEKKFNNWFFGSAGYLYSKLEANSSFNMDNSTLLEVVNIPRINLEQESHVGNLNGIFGPFDSLVIAAAAQAEWTHQHGFGDGILDEESTPPPISILSTPFNVASDYDEASLQESLSLHYSRIPFTSLFAEGRFEQQNIAQDDQFSAAEDILNKAVFMQHTAFSSQSGDVRAGFNTSPWRSMSFNVQYRRKEDDSQYDSSPLVQPIATAYPTFIHSRDLTTDEVEAKLIWHPSPRFKTVLSYQYQDSDFLVDTAQYVSFGNVISPGGQLVGGESTSHTFSLNATVTPNPRLYLSTIFSYQTLNLGTSADGSTAIVPYRGDTYTVLANGTYVLNQTTDVSASYAFSEADYGQDDFAGGLPLGIEYQQHSAQIGLTRRFGKNISTKLQYRFDYYSEPTSGGATDFLAHSIFGTLVFRLP